MGRKRGCMGPGELAIALGRSDTGVNAGFAWRLVDSMMDFHKCLVHRSLEVRPR
jgi:hypothetical protein